MIKTCELKTCDELHTVELKDVLYSPDSVTIKRVSGETILNLPIDLNSIGGYFTVEPGEKVRASIVGGQKVPL
jgi:hypothetical protein